MRLKNLLLALVLVGTGCASSTKSAPQAETDEPGQARGVETKKQEAVAKAGDEKDKDEPICKQEQTIGSNMTKRVCRTREQIERERREAQEWARRSARQSGAAGQN